MYMYVLTNYDLPTIDGCKIERSDFQRSISIFEIQQKSSAVISRVGFVAKYFFEMRERKMIVMKKKKKKERKRFVKRRDGKEKNFRIN